jgi:hypothetical protein
MWKKETNVFGANGSSYMGFAADLKSNVFEAQQSSKVQPNKPVDANVPIARLDLKTKPVESRKRSTAEVVNDAVEAANIHDRLLEKAAKYEHGEGSDVLDHERKKFEGLQEPSSVSNSVRSLLDRVPATLPVVGHPDVEAERAKRRERRLETLGNRTTSEKVQALLKE